jgi:hypothetical protein
VVAPGGGCGCVGSVCRFLGCVGSVCRFWVWWVRVVVVDVLGPDEIRRRKRGGEGGGAGGRKQGGKRLTKNDLRPDVRRIYICQKCILSCGVRPDVRRVYIC